MTTREDLHAQIARIEELAELYTGLTDDATDEFMQCVKIIRALVQENEALKSQFEDAQREIELHNTLTAPGTTRGAESYYDKLKTAALGMWETLEFYADEIRHARVHNDPNSVYPTSKSDIDFDKGNRAKQAIAQFDALKLGGGE